MALLPHEELYKNGQFIPSYNWYTVSIAIKHIKPNLSKSQVSQRHVVITSEVKADKNVLHNLIIGVHLLPLRLKNRPYLNLLPKMFW